MPSARRTFYQYLGLHSLLIGLFPFYLPVYLWSEQFGLVEISFFISFAGAGFCLGLWVWDRLRLQINLSTLIGLSLVMEILLLCNVYVLSMQQWVFLLLGFTYGVYNCFYWTTQRALFFDLIDVATSGRKYGNFQIFVGVLLQIGILTGGVLLDQTNFSHLLVVSTIIASCGFCLIIKTKPCYPATLVRHKSLTLKKVIHFRDQHHSRLMFIIDGFYLFIESFFWIITLFLLAHESFAQLGLLVLLLAVIFGVLFFAVKNTIDRFERNRVYKFAVVLYALSWVLRALTDETLSLEVIYAMLVVITFCTAFFRLAMNKRFYDVAKLTLGHDYLVLKSYYSQSVIAILYLAMAVFFMQFEQHEQWLIFSYWLSAGLAFGYLLYAKQGDAS